MDLKATVGLLLFAGILAAIGLIAAGIVLFAVLGNAVRGRQFMRAGATVFLGTAFVGISFNILSAGGRLPSWDNAVKISATLLILVAVPPLLKRYRERQKP